MLASCTRSQRSSCRCAVSRPSDRGASAGPHLTASALCRGRVTVELASRPHAGAPPSSPRRIFACARSHPGPPSRRRVVMTDAEAPEVGPLRRRRLSRQRCTGDRSRRCHAAYTCALRRRKAPCDEIVTLAALAAHAPPQGRARCRAAWIVSSKPCWAAGQPAIQRGQASAASVVQRSRCLAACAAAMPGSFTPVVHWLAAPASRSTDTFASPRACGQGAVRSSLPSPQRLPASAAQCDRVCVTPGRATRKARIRRAR